jgi:hypothetical protein
MNTPNETPEQNSSDQAASKGKRPDRTQRAAFWLRTIELRKQKLTRDYRKSLRDTAREGISDEEHAAMLGTLEKMARNLGWDESQTDEHPFGHGFGHGHDHDHDDAGHEHRHPGAKRGFRRLHPKHHDRDLHSATVPTDTPQA